MRAGDPRLRELARLVDGAVIGRTSAAYARAYASFNERFDGVQAFGGIARRRRRRRAAGDPLGAKARHPHPCPLGRAQLRGLLDRGGRARDRPRRARQDRRQPAGTDAPPSEPGRLLIDVYARLAKRRRDHSGRLVSDGRRGRARPRWRGRLRVAQARNDGGQRPRTHDRDRGRAGAHLRSIAARRSVLGLPRWRRWQLRRRHELPLPHPSGRLRRRTSC